MKIKPQTPLGQLMLEKQEVLLRCQETETKIKRNLQYVRSHSGRLLLSGIAALFTPHTKTQDEGPGRGLAHNPWMRLAWQIAKPIAYRWMGEIGWQVFKSMFRKRR